MKSGYLVIAVFLSIFLFVALVLASGGDIWKRCKSSEEDNCYTVSGKAYRCCLIDGQWEWIKGSTCSSLTCPSTTTTTTTTTATTTTTTTATTTTISTTTTTIPGPAINPPSVETVGYENLAQTSVTLKGKLNSCGGANICLVWFEYGTSSSSYDHSTSYQAIDCTSVSLPYYFSAYISGLSPGTTYYFEAKAKNGGSW
jgi:hypothetical protein